jgi:hypothetical protein
MRIDGDGKAIYELTLLLTPDEARQAIAVLDQLLASVPTKEKISENEFDDAPTPSEGGTRLVRLVVYAGPEAERRHDADFGPIESP